MWTRCGLIFTKQDASRKEELEKKIAERVSMIEEKKANILQNPYSKSIYKRCAIKDILGDDQASPKLELSCSLTWPIIRPHAINEGKYLRRERGSSA